MPHDIIAQSQNMFLLHHLGVFKVLRNLRVYTNSSCQSFGESDALEHTKESTFLMVKYNTIKCDFFNSISLSYSNGLFLLFYHSRLMRHLPWCDKTPRVHMVKLALGFDQRGLNISHFEVYYMAVQFRAHAQYCSLHGSSLTLKIEL